MYTVLGHYCPIASVVPTQCGGSNLYCPVGMALPIVVQPGYYTTGGTNTTRCVANA